MACSHCQGSGYAVNDPDWVKSCGYCSGTGHTYQERMSRSNNSDSFSVSYDSSTSYSGDSYSSSYSSAQYVEERIKKELKKVAIREHAAFLLHRHPDIYGSFPIHKEMKQALKSDAETFYDAVIAVRKYATVEKTKYHPLYLDLHPNMRDEALTLFYCFKYLDLHPEHKQFTGYNLYYALRYLEKLEQGEYPALPIHPAHHPELTQRALSLASCFLLLKELEPKTTARYAFTKQAIPLYVYLKQLQQEAPDLYGNIPPFHLDDIPALKESILTFYHGEKEKERQKKQEEKRKRREAERLAAIQKHAEQSPLVRYYSDKTLARKGLTPATAPASTLTAIDAAAEKRVDKLYNGFFLHFHLNIGNHSHVHLWVWTAVCLI